MAENFKSIKIINPYYVGLGISMLLVSLSILFYNNFSLPLIFSIVCMMTYLGVIVRGRADKDSWGKTNNAKRFSLYIGIILDFVIPSVTVILMLNNNFDFKIKSHLWPLLVCCFLILSILILVLIYYSKKLRNHLPE